MTEFKTINQPQYGGGMQPPQQTQQPQEPAYPQQAPAQPQGQYVPQAPPVQTYGQQYQPGQQGQQQQQQGPPPPQQTQQNQRQYYRGRGQQQSQPRQIIRKPTQSGQPLVGLNYVCYRGYLAEPQYGSTQAGRPYIRFNILIPTPVIENGQPALDANGNQLTREQVWRCEAWLQVAEELSQVQEGTPIFVEGNNHKYSFKSQQTGQNVWVQDLKVTRWQYL